MATELIAVYGDITKMNVDAIVNAANRWLMAGGGVDGAIHRAAGPELQRACEQIEGGCPTGEARITPGFRLPATWVIHAVGPVWQGGYEGERELLVACYRNSLTLATAYQLRSIAFPAISIGVYGFPVELATAIAVQAVHDFCTATPTTVERAIFACYSPEVLQAYERVLAQAQ
jgi:O-acetyl-ADP-ribose deacetylase (regulator of RNase III)